MRRLLVVGAGLSATWIACAATACAVEFQKFPEHPDLKGGASSVQNMPLGPGFYFSWFTLPATWILFLLWVRTCDWINCDGQALRIEYRRWNMIAVFPFAVAFLLLWLLPWFWLDFPLLVLTYLVPLVVYVKYRNKQVTVDETVFTPAHIRFWLSEHLRPLGIKIASERKREGPAIELLARGAASDSANQANQILARQSQGHRPAQELMLDAISRRAESILMDFTQQSVTVRYQIDGVWHDAEPRTREEGDLLLATLKTLATLDPKQRAARQQGTFVAEHDKRKYEAQITSGGTKTGERVLIRFRTETRGLRKLSELDMREKMAEQLKQVIEEHGGIIVVSAPPQGGLTTLFLATVEAMDRFVRALVAIEPEGLGEMKVENVNVTTYNPDANETPATRLPKLIREHPDAFVVGDMVNAETATILCEQATTEGRTVVTSVRAKEASEALLRIMMLKVPPESFAAAARASLNTRLIRKLCEHCKEAYPPPEKVLQQLGIPAGRVEAFYRPPQEPEEVCKECGGIGYKGRTALFELLLVDDGVRQALTKTPQLAAVRQAARKAGMRTLQEEGILLVAKGVTSLQELTRVLKE